MQWFTQKRIIICLSVLYWFTRLPYIYGSYHVLEPDEAHYQVIIDQIGFNRPWPKYQGEYYLEQFPLFHGLSAIIQPIFKHIGPYAGSRFLAMLGTYIGGLALWWHGSKKKNFKFGLISAVLFWSMPLVIFYSRSGTLDMFALGFLIWSLCLFEVNNKSNKWLWISGLLWGLSILSKTAMAVFTISFIAIMLAKKISWKKISIFFSGCLTAIIPAVGLLWLVFKQSLIEAIVAMPSRHSLSLTHPRVHLAILQLYGERFIWFYGMAVFVSLVLFFFSKKPLKEYLFPLALAAGGIVFVSIFDYWPRYALLLTPALAIFAAYGLMNLKQWLLVPIVLLAIGYGYYSWSAGNHTSLQVVATTTQHLHQLTNLPIFTTFEPYKFSHLAHVSAMYVSRKAECGGIVISDTQQGPIMADYTEPEFVELRQAMKEITTLTPSETIHDPLSHFPYSANGNTFKFYVIPKTQSCSLL